jgi:hypothetical protein
MVGHPEDRSDERSILTPDVYKLLQTGFVLDQPVRNGKGDWEAVIQRRIRGTRTAAAATIILTDSSRLIVKTIMWLDQ